MNGKIMNDDIKLGQKIIIKNKLVRREERRKETGIYKTKKVWLATDSNYPVEGIFLGYRTLNNGHRRFHYDVFIYKPTEYFKAALVVVNANENPFYSTNIEKG